MRAIVDDAPFGAEGVLDFIKSRKQSTASEMAERLFTAVRQFASHAPQVDDIMSIICKVE